MELTTVSTHTAAETPGLVSGIHIVPVSALRSWQGEAPGGSPHTPALQTLWRPHPTQSQNWSPGQGAQGPEGSGLLPVPLAAPFPPSRSIRPLGSFPHRQAQGSPRALESALPSAGSTPFQTPPQGSPSHLSWVSTLISPPGLRRTPLPGHYFPTQAGALASGHPIFPPYGTARWLSGVCFLEASWVFRGGGAVTPALSSSASRRPAWRSRRSRLIHVLFDQGHQYRQAFVTEVQKVPSERAVVISTTLPAGVQGLILIEHSSGTRGCCGQACRWPPPTVNFSVKFRKNAGHQRNPDSTS